MLDRTQVDTLNRVTLLVRRLLSKRAIEPAVGLDDDLGASGLSSLDIVNLMLSVEAEFDIKIPDRDMKPANFRSIARINTLVGALLRGTQPATGSAA